MSVIWYTVNHIHTKYLSVKVKPKIKTESFAQIIPMIITHEFLDWHTESLYECL